MTDESTTTAEADAFETETRTKTRVEHEVEHVTEEYEVTTCEWCGGVHPIEETVAIGIGERDGAVERTLGTLRMEDINNLAQLWFDPAEGVSYDDDYSLDGIRTTFDGEVELQVTDHHAPQTNVPFCAWCAGEVFGIDVETALAAPAKQAYDPDEFGSADAAERAVARTPDVAKGMALGGMALVLFGAVASTSGATTAAMAFTIPGLVMVLVAGLLDRAVGGGP